MTDEAVADLRLAILVTEQLFRLVGPSQLQLDTPCDGWSVADLTHHMVAMLGMYGDAFAAAAPERGEVDGDGLPAAEAFTTAGRRLLELVAAAAPGTTVTVPFGTVPPAVAIRLATVEMLVHGWDLATATSQTYRCDPGVAERALAFSVSALERLPSDRSPFAPTVPVEEDAPAIDRLVGLLGRRP